MKFDFFSVTYQKPCRAPHYFTYHSLTEGAEVNTGKSQLRLMHQGGGLRFPCNDRTEEVNQLFKKEIKEYWK